MKSVLYWPSSPEYRACLSGWYTHSFGENWVSLSLQVSIANSFLVWSRTLCLLTSLSAGLLSGLNLHKSPVCCQNLCEFPCVSSVVSRICCLLGVTSGSYNRAFCLFSFIEPWALRRGLMRRSPSAWVFSLLLSALPICESLLIATYCKKLLWQGLNNILIWVVVGHEEAFLFGVVCLGGLFWDRVSL